MKISFPAIKIRECLLEMQWYRIVYRCWNTVIIKVFTQLIPITGHNRILGIYGRIIWFNMRCNNYIFQAISIISALLLSQLYLFFKILKLCEEYCGLHRIQPAINTYILVPVPLLLTVDVETVYHIRYFFIV